MTIRGEFTNSFINIFADFLNIKAAFDKNPGLDNLLLDDFFRDAIHNCQVFKTSAFIVDQIYLTNVEIKFQDDWRNVVSRAVKLGVSTPCFSTALSFYYGYRFPSII